MFTDPDMRLPGGGSVCSTRDIWISLHNIAYKCSCIVQLCVCLAVRSPGRDGDDRGVRLHLSSWGEFFVMHSVSQQAVKPIVD